MATVSSLPGCHTQARSLDQLMERVREAIELYPEIDGYPAGEHDFVGLQRFCVEASTGGQTSPSNNSSMCCSWGLKAFG